MRTAQSRSFGNKREGFVFTSLPKSSYLAFRCNRELGSETAEVMERPSVMNRVLDLTRPPVRFAGPKRECAGKFHHLHQNRVALSVTIIVGCDDYYV
jgi:hypothetical protein